MVPALMFKVIAVRAAAPIVTRRIRIFILTFFYLDGALLRHRNVVLALPRRAGNPAKVFLRGFSKSGV
jgi:hypothetical protein